MTIRKIQPTAPQLSTFAFVALLAGYLGWLYWPVLEAMPVHRQPQDLSAEGSFLPKVRTPVETFSVQRTDLSIRAEATGYLDPIRQLDIVTESSQRIHAIEVVEGQRVEVDQLLISFDSRAWEIELAEAEADLLETQAKFAISYEAPGALGADEVTSNTGQVVDAEADLQRARAQVEAGLQPKRQIEEAQQRLELAKLRSGSRRREVQAATSGLTQSEQRVARARLNLERSRVVAAFAGRVADLEVQAGQQTNAGEKCLSLLDDSRLRVDVSVLEADIVHLRPGALAAVKVPAVDEIWREATILYVNPRVDREKGTGRVTLGLANPGSRLMPGLFAYVRLETRNLDNRLAVPVEGVLERQGRELVFRIIEGRAIWTWVETGARSGNLVEIVQGLAEGDEVAVGNHFALAHEAPVEVVPRPTTTTAESRR